MEDPINNYIKEVSIKELWGKYDLNWELHPDVNILAGGNGMGKSTVLRCLSSTGEYFRKGEEETSMSSDVLRAMKGISINFADNLHYSLDINWDSGSFRDEIPLMHNPSYWRTISYLNRSNSLLLSSEAVQKLSDKRVKTELDWQVYQLQIQYRDYQINLAREKDRILDENPVNAIDQIQELRKPHTLFINMLNELLGETQKQVDETENEVAFLLEEAKKMSAYELSSGEKHILVILLTVLIQNQKPTIFILDDPEVSLHIDWQKKMIGLIRELNPNVQLIIATHSPAIIMEGWMDKVFNIQDLLTPSNT